MQDKLYKVTSIFLLSLSLVSIIFLLLIYLLPQGVISGTSWFGTIVFIKNLILPFYTLPLVLFSGIYLLIIGFKKKITNKVMDASAIIYFITLPSLVLAILLGLLPCLFGPPDGLCMLFGAPFMFLNFLCWVVGFFVLISGVIIQKKNQ